MDQSGCSLHTVVYIKFSVFQHVTVRYIWIRNIDWLWGHVIVWSKFSHTRQPRQSLFTCLLSLNTSQCVNR